MKLRRLTASGIGLFAAYLDQLKAEPTLAPPVHLLTEADTSEPLTAELDVQARPFATRLEAATYLDQALPADTLPHADRDAGLWAWLALFYFDQVCPVGKGGGREPGESARYIPQLSVSRRYYRHLLLGPFVMLRAHIDDPARLRALLSSPMHVATSETYRLFIENPSLLASRPVVDTATWLYYDTDRAKLKRGAGSKEPGGCRRLVDFLQQIDCTYDLQILTKDRLTQLLPKEFHRYVPNQFELIS